MRKYIENGNEKKLLKLVFENGKAFAEFANFVEKAMDLRKQILKWNYRF